jgi:hypothetical protein
MRSLDSTDNVQSSLAFTKAVSTRTCDKILAAVGVLLLKMSYDQHVISTLAQLFAHSLHRTACTNVSGCSVLHELINTDSDNPHKQDERAWSYPSRCY